MIFRFLILAHKNLDQLERLLKQIESSSSYIFIHIDKKYNLTASDIDRLELNKNTYILNERISNQLDCFSLIESTLLLIKYSNKVCKGPGYYILMSGQDYMIKPFKDLEHLLKNNYPKPFIDCTPYDKSNWIHNKFCFTSLDHKIFEFRINKPFILRKGLGALTKILRLIPYKRISVLDKFKKHSMNLYGGSAWWVLPDVIIKEIVSLIENEKEIVDIFKHSYTPEETFFQTFAMQTRFSNTIKLNNIDERKQNCLTYANFEPPVSDGHNFSGHPYILRENDFSWLIKRPEFIARKFDIKIDSNIFDLIDDFIKH